MKIDLELIARGRALNRLLDSEDFRMVLDELSSRIADQRHGVLEVVPNEFTRQKVAAYQALFNFREWMDGEIESAGKEILKQQDEARQSQKDPQEAIANIPSNGQMEKVNE